MSDLVVWLEAELARVEELTRAAGGGEIEAVDYLWGTKYLDVRQPDGEAKQTTEFSAELADHFATNSPASVLRRVAADRQILALHQLIHGAGFDEHDQYVGMEACTSCGTHDEYGVPWPCRTVLLLAEAYGWTEDAS